MEVEEVDLIIANFVHQQGKDDYTYETTNRKYEKMYWSLFKFLIGDRD
tara:strand:- start:568 stop:711 length:144 start_codon:yes stop_codon:yes gene_type:complete